MGVEIGDVPFVEIRDDVKRTFNQVAADKGLELEVHIDENIPESMQTDFKRLRQVLKNLLSNAFKFTNQGRIELNIAASTRGWSFDNESLNRAPSVIAFCVSDTGIGIPEEKQQLIFEAFQQADGTTSRKYGGTGLGLSISREIARLLGGEITLESSVGDGSTFTFYLPRTYESVGATPAIGEHAGDGADGNGRVHSSLVVLSRDSVEEAASRVQLTVSDDRNNLQPSDKVIQIIEDDSSFARILQDIVHEQGFKCLVSHHGDDALMTAREIQARCHHFGPDASGRTWLCSFGPAET